MKNLLLSLLITCLTISCKDETTREITNRHSNSGVGKVYTERQKRLMKKTENGVIFIRSDYGFSGGRHEFRAASNFYYLTGYKQNGSILMLNSGNLHAYTLFITKNSIAESIYTGETPQPEEIMKNFLADKVLPLEQSDQEIEECIKKKIPIYIDYTDVRFRTFIQEIIKDIKGDINLLKDIEPVISEMRVIKDSLEIVEIQNAIDITGKSFLNACRICLPGKFEYEIEAMIEYTFRKNGSAMPAFQSIVGSGPNSVKLHYSGNNRLLQNGDLLLMDIGTEYGYYCGDITRTIPVSGKFSKEQSEIYELVLKSQKAAIAEMKPENYIIAGHNTSARILVNGLFDLGLITDTTSMWQKKFYLLYPVSHYLGMDVHDVGDYGATFKEMKENIALDKNYGRKLEKGMVLTVEPGLYFRSNGLSQLSEMFQHEALDKEIKNFIEKVGPVYEKYLNCGIRIEDNILITNDSCEILSKKIPKELNEIEGIMKKGNRLEINY